MGHFSDLAIQEMEDRINREGLGDKQVCARCFDDPHLARFIARKATGSKCDYCGESGKKVRAAPILDLIDHILPLIEREYEDAEFALPRDPETKDHMFPEDILDAREMLELEIGLGLPRDHDGRLMDDIAGALPDQAWCRISPLATAPAQTIGNSWDAFKTIIKHRRRFFFLQHEDAALAEDMRFGEAAYTVAELLAQIADFARRSGMIVPLAKGSLWYRSQAMAAGEKDFPAPRMGPPPYEHATLPNRMSPAGVPMFYGAASIDTALAETADGPGRFALGRFATLRDIQVLDMRRLPEVPSLFDEARAPDRPFARFMQHFVEEFGAPIDRERRPHVDYVPTQVVTEYVRTMVKADKAAPVEGMLYTSSRDGRDAIVLFAENDAVVGAEAGEIEPWLEMTDYLEVDFDPAAK